MAETAVKSRDLVVSSIKPPSRYKVVVCNDDVTPMEFVIAMLVSVFKHGEEAAIDLTLKIHHDGSAVAGVYSYEIAEQKGIDATVLARDHGHPLQIRVEEE